MKYLKPSQTPNRDLDRVAYPGQSPFKRMYRSGYEDLFAHMPEVDASPQTFKQITQTMSSISERVRRGTWLYEHIPPQAEGFVRTVIGMESPRQEKTGLKEGKEVIVAKWNKNYSSPVHGHSTGYLHEEILFGKVRVNMFRMTAPDSVIVRPVRSDVMSRGVLFVSEYNHPNAEHKFKRQTLIHNFTSLEFTASLHYLPEHTRDGRDNQFTVQYFAPLDVRRISESDAINSKIGDVILVRSEAVKGLGDHFIIITGAPVIKPQGLRPQDVAIHAPNVSHVLDKHMPREGIILLKLSKAETERFHWFHDIKVDKKEVVFP